MGAEPTRPLLPNWPRLMSLELAAAYVSLSMTVVREHGPEPKQFGRRILYDRNDLDRWADRLSGQPLDEPARRKEAAEIERRFREKRRGHH